MSCSSYGAPTAYSNYPSVQQSFYYPQSSDPYNDLTNYSYRQLFQLNRNSLMPASWTNETAHKAMQSDPSSDWYRYSPTENAVNRYITSSGSTRFSMSTRNPMGRIVGTPLLLRTQPPVPLTSDSIPWNESSAREGLVRSLHCA